MLLAGSEATANSVTHDISMVGHTHQSRNSHNKVTPRAAKVPTSLNF